MKSLIRTDSTPPAFPLRDAAPKRKTPLHPWSKTALARIQSQYKELCPIGNKRNLAVILLTLAVVANSLFAIIEGVVRLALGICSTPLAFHKKGRKLIGSLFSTSSKSFTLPRAGWLQIQHMKMQAPLPFPKSLLDAVTLGLENIETTYPDIKPLRNSLLRRCYPLLQILATVDLMEENLSFMIHPGLNAAGQLTSIHLSLPSLDHPLARATLKSNTSPFIPNPQGGYIGKIPLDTPLLPTPVSVK